MTNENGKRTDDENTRIGMMILILFAVMLFVCGAMIGAVAALLAVYAR